MIKGLIISELNSTMKKKDSIHINMIDENKTVEKDTSKNIGFDVYLLHRCNPELISASLTLLGLSCDSEERL